MAKNTDVLIRVVGVNDTDKATNEAIDNIERIGRATKRASKETKKEWGGVIDLFSSVLPRGLQRTVRQLKSTTRSVGRLSNSFTILKAAWASIGIGLIIIALEQIVENWDKITEALGFHNKEAEKTKERNLEVAKSQNELTLETEKYLKTIGNYAYTEEQIAYAISQVNKELGDVIDTEATRSEQIAQATKLLDAKNKVTQAQSDYEAARNKTLNEQVEITNRLTRSHKDYENDWGERQKLEKESLKISVDYIKTSEALVKAEANVAIQLAEAREERQKKADQLTDEAKSEKELAKIKEDLARQEEADLKYLADLEKRVSEEIMLAKIEDEQKRAEKELELRHIESWEKAWDAGASYDQLHLLDEKYLIDLAALKESYREDDIDEGKTPKQIAQEQQALQDELFLILMSEQDREETLLMQKYDRRIELANGNRELELEAEKIFLDQMKALTEDSEAKIQSIKEAGIKATVNAARGLFSTMGKMAEDGSEQAKALAITDVLLAQAVALANGIKVASQSARTPYDLIGGIIASISAVMGAFVGVKAILNEAGASAGGGGGGIPSTTPLVPDQVSRTETTGKTFVVQSDLEGAALQANQLYSQTALGGG